MLSFCIFSDLGFRKLPFGSSNAFSEVINFFFKDLLSLNASSVSSIFKVDNDSAALSNVPVDNAVVKLVEVVCEHGKEERRPIGHTFTDKEGEFVFGPLCPGKEYALQIWVNDTKKIKICAKCHHEGKCLKGDKCDKCDCFIDEKHEPCKKCDKKDGFLKEEDFKDMNF